MTHPLAAHSGKLIGVLGGGQLGMMLAHAGRPHGLRFRFLDPSPKAVARSQGEHIIGNTDDLGDLARFVGVGADVLDAATLEFENVNADSVGWLCERVDSAPNAKALRASQDRLNEKKLFAELGVPTAEFARVDSGDDLRAAAEKLGYPLVIKTRRLGYDGKGQRVVRSQGELVKAFDDLAGHPLIVEAFVPFVRELSIVAARGRDGSMACYPLVENTHAEGILRTTIAPAPNADALNEQAKVLVRRVAEKLDYVGVLTLELFEVATKEGSVLLVNELAPRVHNSGHWTIEGANTSQFEQHLRAMLGCELGNPTPVGHSVMVNLIGEVPEGLTSEQGVHVHVYGKTPRAGRKLGHVTCVGETAEEAAMRAQQAIAQTTHIPIS